MYAGCFSRLIHRRIIRGAGLADMVALGAWAFWEALAGAEA